MQNRLKDDCHLIVERMGSHDHPTLPTVSKHLTISLRGRRDKSLDPVLVSNSGIACV